MKKQLLLLLFTTVLFAISPAISQTKLAVVSADEVFAVMPEVIKADSLLAAYQQALAQSYQNQQNELNAAYAKFVDDTAKMAPTLKEIKRRDLQSKEQNLNKALEAEKEKQLKPIREKMLKAIQDVAKENGYTHVAYKEQLVVFPMADDITDKVKKKLGIK